MSALSKSEQTTMRHHASSIVHLHNAGMEVEAATYCAIHLKTSEQKMAVWCLLPSNVRSSIKRNTKPVLASQA